MLFTQALLPQVADGSVTVAFRRWRRPTVKAGGTLLTPVGQLAIDEVAVIDPADVTDDDARRAGHADRHEVLAWLDGRDGALHRIRFHRLGDDPRHALRERSALTADDVAELTARLDRLDRASRRGRWTADVLALIDRRPAVRAADLAAELGRETLAFKTDVRKLKALGLKESLGTGYRLSPRGQAWLARSTSPSDPA